MESIQFKPIGVIHTPFKKREDAPHQARLGRGIRATVEVESQYQEGLTDLDTFSHIVLVFYLHESQGYSLKSKPPVDDVYHGVFATRSPRRPNAIGVSVVRLEKVDGNILHVMDVDMIDGTPLLDIKPYVPEVNPEDPVKFGWLEGRSETH